jgi:hypothetical protein
MRYMVYGFAGSILAVIVTVAAIVGLSLRSAGFPDSAGIGAVSVGFSDVSVLAPLLIGFGLGVLLARRTRRPPAQKTRGL